MAVTDFIGVDRRPDGCALVTIAREPANVMDLDFWQQLSAAVEDLEKDSSVRGVIFCSGLRRNIFTAGNDIKELYAPRTSAQRYAQFWRVQNDLLARLHCSRLATVVAIRGACPAGGCCLALCCDMRVMSREGGHIGLNEVALGIPVPLFWARLMTRVIGQGKADRLMQTAHMPSPSQALSLGLVDDLVPQDDLLQAAEQHLARLLAVPDAGRVATKLHLRKDFCDAWRKHADHEAGSMFTLLERPTTVQMLEATMKRLSSKKAAKL